MMNFILFIGLVLTSTLCQDVGGTCMDYPANTLDYQFYYLGILYRYQAGSGDMIFSQTAPLSNNSLPNNTDYTSLGIFTYCGNPAIEPSFVPLFEYFWLSPTAGERHVYTTNPSEFNSSYISQFNLTGTVCHVSLVPFEDHVPVYRFWNVATGTYLYTTNPADGTSYPSYWTLQALPFYVGAQYGTTSPFYPIPLYRYRQATSSDTYLTTLTNPPLAAPSENYTYIGVLGSCYPYAHTGWTPIFEYASGTAQTGRHHIYTTNWALLGGGANGFTYQGIPCYVQLSPMNNTLPIYQFSITNPPSKISTLLFTTNMSEPVGDTQVTTWNLVDIPWYMFVDATCDTLSNSLNFLYRYQVTQWSTPVFLYLYPNYHANSQTLTNLGMALPSPVTGFSPIFSYQNAALSNYYTTDWSKYGVGGGSSRYIFMGILGYIPTTNLANTLALYRFTLIDQPTIYDYSVDMSYQFDISYLDGTVGYLFNNSAFI